MFLTSDYGLIIEDLVKSGCVYNFQSDLSEKVDVLHFRLTCS